MLIDRDLGCTSWNNTHSSLEVTLTWERKGVYAYVGKYGLTHLTMAEKVTVRAVSTCWRETELRIGQQEKSRDRFCVSQSQEVSPLWKTGKSSANKLAGRASSRDLGHLWKLEVLSAAFYQENSLHLGPVFYLFPGEGGTMTTAESHIQIDQLFDLRVWRICKSWSPDWLKSWQPLCKHASPWLVKRPTLTLDPGQLLKITS